MEQNETYIPLPLSPNSDSSLTYRRIQAVPHIIAASPLERAAKDSRPAPAPSTMKRPRTPRPWPGPRPARPAPMTHKQQNCRLTTFQAPEAGHGHENNLRAGQISDNFYS